MPQVSEVWQRARELAKSATDPDDPGGAVEVVRFLRGLSRSDWEQVVLDAQAWNQYQAARLLADPSLVPDHVERAKKISRALYGLPWWLREAHYWREKDEGKTKAGRPGKLVEDEEFAALTE